MADAYINRRLKLKPEDAGVEPSGRIARRAGDIAEDTYKYAVRYLVRRKLQDMVFTALRGQVYDHIERLGINQERSLILLAHSLGTVIALDLLAASDIGRYFGKYISMGSPLDFIASIPGVSQIALPPKRRKIQIPWVDGGAAKDIVAIVRISRRLGFDGAPLRRIFIKGTYRDPHGVYFGEPAIVRRWMRELAL